VLVTGAGRGLGREYALLLGRLGASVIVNDLGSSMAGAGADTAAADGVAQEITAGGARAVPDGCDVTDWSDAAQLIDRTVDAFGSLDAVVNNAGILRPRTIVGMTEDEWDDVIRVHVRGTFAVTHFAALYWRAQAKAGKPRDARVVNTTSGSGLYGNGQANYASAKAAVAAMTLIAADELGHYGVTANAVAPVARTRMAIDAIPEHYQPAAVAPLVAWLVSPRSRGVTGQVFNVGGGHISVAEGWHTGPGADQETAWTVEALDQVVPGLVARAAPRPDLLGYYPGEERSPLLPDLQYSVPGAKPT
jgi:NAD(P)-dependent dehydrogenase (short-subunit alcohol dehydrogenase family)